MHKKLIVVSMDALIYEDLEHLAQKPSFGKLLQECALVKRVRSIYPTLTYPCHATMATGCLPKKHGVLNNTRLEPGTVSPPWLWYHESYHCRDIVDACKEAGLTTACIGWPTMGCHPSADYIVGEIAATTAKTPEEFRRDYLRTGTTEGLWEAVGAPNVHYRTELRSPTHFNTAACRDIIRLYAPDLVLLHIGEPDHTRHLHGVFAPEVTGILDVCEWALTELLNAIRDSGFAHCTNLVITADHGQLDTVRSCSPNALFARESLLTLDEAGAVTDWKAWSDSVGMCAAIYVKHPEDIPTVEALLKRELPDFRLYSREEAAREGYDGGFAFVLETDGKTRFENHWTGPLLTEPGAVRGYHGYHPDKGPQPPILAMGPGFRRGAVLENANLIDGAPTWAKLLGASLPDAEGRSLDEILI